MKRLWFAVLCVLMIFEAGCASVVRVRRPSTVVIAAGSQKETVYVAKDQASSLPGQNLPESELVQVDTNGLIQMIGVFYNTHPFAIVLDTSRIEVCFGSELKMDRPAQDDKCWLTAGTIQNVVIPPINGSSPWLRVYTNGGYEVFVYKYPIGAGQIVEQVVKWPIDFYSKDAVCPGNRLVDFSIVAGYNPAQHGGAPYCISTRLMQ